MELSEKLATLRKNKGLSQLELAEAINVSRQAISRWEVGTATPSAENLKFLSEYYEISIDELLDITVDDGRGDSEGKPVAESMEYMGEGSGESRPVDECDNLDSNGSIGDLDGASDREKIFVLSTPGLQKLFAVIVIIWVAILIFGYLGHAMLAAKLFILLSGILLLIGYVGSVVIKYFKRK